MIRASVVLATFNHEPWIAQAIDSVVAQRTTFAVELVILEDCSTDRTREIVLDYARRYPGRIQLRLSATNCYDRAVWHAALLDASAPYVSLLDGDDYWTSPDKLQRQVDYLDAHPECAICVHNARVVHVGTQGTDHDYIRPGRKPISGLPDILSSNFIPTCGTMLRKVALQPLPPWTLTAKWDDWSLYIAAARNGTIGYIDEVMGVYRRHAGGAWSGLDRAQQVQGLIEFLEQMKPALDHQYDGRIDQRIAELRAAP